MLMIQFTSRLIFFVHHSRFLLFPIISLHFTLKVLDLRTCLNLLIALISLPPHGSTSYLGREHMESPDGLGWKWPQRPSSSNLHTVGRITSHYSRLMNPHQTWLCTLPKGTGHPHLLWANSSVNTLWIRTVDFCLS